MDRYDKVVSGIFVAPTPTRRLENSYLTSYMAAIILNDFLVMNISFSLKFTVHSHVVGEVHCARCM